MGCFWSSEGREHCAHCNRTAVNNLVIIDHVCEICINRAARSHYLPPGPKFGEYRCSACGRYWNSRWCWPNKYQMCQNCKIATLPYKYRDLEPTDLTSSADNRHEHVRELCQMCLQLGHSCKDFNKKYKPQTQKTTCNSKTTKMRTYPKHW
ncbi:zinc finger CCHC domain-containing protein 24-like [Maniola hyperantus]|uniref:zinc finger CCHC domain-containing protein 24-like n=1 Tax=Aphantopus hyperantus TaxID=2795564 RepID=UPI001568AB76|nr:zinc finger CCHC domain-containing protein 24-like [Maniola hyperantus]